MATDHYPCPLFNSSRQDTYQLVIVNIRVSVACFSFLGSLFVIGLVWLFKKYKFFTQRLILYLSIASLISSIAYLLGRVDYNSTSKKRFCIFTGFLLLYSDWSVLLSTIGVTLNLFLKVTWEAYSNKYEVGYFLLSFGVPLVFIWIPFTFDAYGPSGAWCWIKSKHDDCSTYTTGKAIQFLVWYIPLYLLIGVLFLVYIYIVVRVTLQVKKWQGVYSPYLQRQRILLKEEIKPLLWYPVIYLTVQLFPFINRIVYTFTNEAIIGLFILHVSTSPLTGVLIAFAYALDKETLQRLNWRSIKANIMFRSTGQVVHSYSITETYEEELDESHSHSYLNHLLPSDSDNSGEDLRLVSTTTSFTS